MITHPVYSVNLHPSYASLQQISENLKAHIDKISHQTGIHSFILIGHSMGGLVAGYYAEYLNQQQQIKQIFTLGSPLYGTKIATIAFTPNGKQMRPKSPFLKQLREKIKTTSTSYFHLASQLDNMIFPWSSAFIQENPHQIYLELTHQELIHHSQVVHDIVQNLK